MLVRKTWRLSLVWSVLAMTLAGCPPCEPYNQVHFVEDFEGCDPFCGWQIEGEGRIVSTVHPAEHALWLGAGASALLEVDLSIPEQALDLELVGSVTSLTLALGWETTAGPTTQTLIMAPCDAGEGSDYRRLCADVAAGRPAGASRIASIRIDADASCILDRLFLWTWTGGGGC